MSEGSVSTPSVCGVGGRSCARKTHLEEANQVGVGVLVVDEEAGVDGDSIDLGRRGALARGGDRGRPWIVRHTLPGHVSASELTSTVLA